MVKINFSFIFQLLDIVTDSKQFHEAKNTNLLTNSVTNLHYKVSVRYTQELLSTKGDLCVTLTDVVNPIFGRNPWQPCVFPGSINTADHEHF